MRSLSISGFSARFVGSLLILSLCAVQGMPILGSPSVSAASVDDLQKQKDQLEQKAKQAEQQAAQQKTVAQRAAEKIQQVSSQIYEIRTQMADTDSSIEKTQEQIGEQNQKIASLESELRSVKDTQSALVREMYKVRLSMPDDLVMFSDEPIGVREQRQAHFDALKKSVASIYSRTAEAKHQVENNRAELVKQSDSLKSLKEQQDEQQRGLADFKYQQAQLQEDAQAAVVALENKAKEARRQEQSIENQISVALSAIIAERARSGMVGGKNVGARVTRGTIIGHLGSTGFSTGPHVHFEVRLNNTPVNPQPYINNGTFTWPVRNFTISQGFGYTDYSASGAYGGGIHTGIDLAGPYGQPVYAPADGVVILNQYYGGYGNAWAEQLDNGLVALCGHMTGS